MLSIFHKCRIESLINFVSFHPIVSISADTSKTPAQLDRDAGFCSGGSEIGDDYQSERLQNSPSTTDISDDSVDIKLSSIEIPSNKRKSLSTQKSENDIPLKKRIRYEAVFGITNDTDSSMPTDTALNQPNACRPWIPANALHPSGLPNEAEILTRHPAVTTLHCLPNEDSVKDLRTQSEDDQPLALVTRKSYDDKKSNTKTTTKLPRKRSATSKSHNAEVTIDRTNTTDSIDTQSNATKSSVQMTHSTSQKSKSSNHRNYKNMTRERRIEANARERTRVHTISAAFDTLRQAVPSYSSTQKLSKLSVLRVACSYILTLSRMAGEDYSAEQDEPSIASCMEEITRTIQTEGKSRKRKDD